MKKDAQASVRINRDILERIKKDGMTVQRILDEYIERKYTITEIFTISSKSKRVRNHKSRK